MMIESYSNIRSQTSSLMQLSYNVCGLIAARHFLEWWQGHQRFKGDCSMTELFECLSCAPLKELLTFSSF